MQCINESAKHAHGDAVEGQNGSYNSMIDEFMKVSDNRGVHEIKQVEFDWSCDLIMSVPILLLHLKQNSFY